MSYYHLTNNHCSQPLELIHLDVWGSTLITFFNGFNYFIFFIDDYSLFTWLYPLKNKSDVFKQFKLMVEKQLPLPIKRVYSDWGEEF